MKLILVSSPERKEFLLGQVNTIGRHSNNSIQILDGNISKEHAEVIRTEDGKYVLRDKGSLNGTFVADKAITEHTLEDGDTIKLGSTVLEFQTRKARAVEDKTIITNLIESNIRERLDAELSKDFPPVLEVMDIDTLKRDYEKLRIAHKFARSISTDLDEEKLIPRILDTAFELLNAERGVIMLMNDEGVLDAPDYAQRWRDDGREGEINISKTIINEVLTTNAAVLSADAKVDDRFDSSKSVIREGIRSTMVVPLVQADELIGIMHVDSLIAANAFSEKDLQIFTAIANQAAVAIANARMAREIEDEAKQKAVLSRLLSPNLVQEVMTGKLTMGTSGERRTVTILFADIRGFTAMAEGSDPQSIVEMLNDYFDHMVEVLFRHGGTIDKYVGDELMGLFGAPMDMEDAPQRAIECALDMTAVLKDFNAYRATQGKPQVKVGFGIDTGEVVCGLMGALQTQEGTVQYTAIGDSVNTASRLCDMAKPGQILISQRTLDRVSGKFETQVVGEVQVKGKAEKLLVFNVTGVNQKHEPFGAPDENTNTRA